MRHAITVGFDYSVTDFFDDVLDKLTKALERFDIQVFVTPNADNETFSIDLYKFVDKTDENDK